MIKYPLRKGRLQKAIFVYEMNKEKKNISDHHLQDQRDEVLHEAFKMLIEEDYFRENGVTISYE